MHHVGKNNFLEEVHMKKVALVVDNSAAMSEKDFNENISK